MMNRVDVCRSPGCGRSVVWLRFAASQKKAPIAFAPEENGNCIVVDAEGDQTILESAVAYRVLRKGEYAPMPRYLSHFATCKAAAAFRGRGRGRGRGRAA